MISTFIIVFRETLEAALIVSIVMASSRGIAGRTRFVVGGLLAGLLGAGVVALFADAIGGLFGGLGSEVFNASVLLLAVVMLGWHQVWMGTHGAELAAQSRSVGQAVREGVRPLSALAVVTGIAVLREGSETVLFLYGIAADSRNDATSMLGGAVLGIASAAALGWMIYTGLLRVPLRHIFRVTGAILMLLAAGLAAQAASYLVQSGFLPPLGYEIWDTSGILSQDNPLGLVLHVLVGYVDRPAGIQIVFYATTLVTILIASTLVRQRMQAHKA